MATRKVVVLAGGAIAVAALWRSLSRVEVVGSSMSPTLLPGDRLLVMSRRVLPFLRPRPGEVVSVRHPEDPSRVLIKRVLVVDRVHGTLEVVGDAGDASTDSRDFGPVPLSSVIGRAVYRYAPAGRSGPVPWPSEYHRA